MDWTIKASPCLTKSVLFDIVNGNIPAVVLPDFLDEEERRHSLAVFGRAARGNYAHVGASLKRAGVTQSEFFGKDLAEALYFGMAEKFTRENAELNKDRAYLMGKVLRALRGTGMTAELLKGTDGEPFLAGVYRLATGLRLHSDWVPRDAAGWTNADVSAQLAVNIHLSRCDDGGELVLYNRSWNKRDEQWKRTDGYGYHGDVVADLQPTIIAPQLGDLIIFDCRKYHEVRATNGGERLTFGVHLGLRLEENFVCWS